MMVASFYVPDTPNDLLQNGQYTEAIRSIKFWNNFKKQNLK